MNLSEYWLLRLAENEHDLTYYRDEDGDEVDEDETEG